MSKSRVVNEKRFVKLFCLLAVMLPLLFVELHPFSLYPMYSYRLAKVAKYKIVDPNAKYLESRKFGLEGTSLGANRFHQHRGRRPEFHSVNIWGKPVLGPDELKKHLQPRLAETDLQYLDVAQRIYGPIDVQRVGLLSKEVYRVAR